MEEPLHRHDFRGLAELRRRARVRIAGARAIESSLNCERYLHHGSLDVYQPDVVWSTGVPGAPVGGGSSGGGAIYSPHTWGDGLVLLANLHVSAAVSQAPLLYRIPVRSAPLVARAARFHPAVADYAGCNGLYFALR
ncbi:MAG: hypothetical protein H6632_03770 [Anaerolineales bacterium]|nr:hypothetical protein [Anaerolineales bacterium]